MFNLKPNTKIIQEQIKKYYKHQLGFSKILGTSQSYVSRILTGSRYLDTEGQLFWAKKLKINRNKLFSQEYQEYISTSQLPVFITNELIQEKIINQTKIILKNIKVTIKNNKNCPHLKTIIINSKECWKCKSYLGTNAITNHVICSYKIKKDF